MEISSILGHRATCRSRGLGTACTVFGSSSARSHSALHLWGPASTARQGDGAATQFVQRQPGPGVQAWASRTRPSYRLRSVSSRLCRGRQQRLSGPWPGPDPMGRIATRALLLPATAVRSLRQSRCCNAFRCFRRVLVPQYLRRDLANSLGGFLIPSHDSLLIHKGLN